MSSACATSLCKGCTAAAAAVPRPPSLPPGERLWRSSLTLTLALLGRHWQLLLSHWLCLSCSQAVSCSPNSCSGQPQLQVLGSHLVWGKTNAGDFFFSPATALLLLLLAVTGATLVLLQGNLLPLSPSLGPGVGGGEQHGDPPPASGGGHAGDLLAAPALAPHHMHQSGLSVAKKAHSNLRVHARER